MALCNILDRMDVVAVISGGCFAGAAAYISFSDVPALCDFGLNQKWKFFPRYSDFFLTLMAQNYHQFSIWNPQ